MGIYSCSGSIFTGMCILNKGIIPELDMNRHLCVADKLDMNAYLHVADKLNVNAYLCVADK